MSPTEPYFIREPETAPAPLVLSIPHCGTAFPDELSGHYVPELAEAPDDTDWFLQDLYDFAPSIGVTMIHARYSRWVIDLNREPGNRPLYDDGRIITALCPETDFLGNPIYTDPTLVPDDEEIERRLEHYFRPYHRKIDEVIAERLERFGSVAFWDGHSIRRVVSTIREEPFPDFILGTNDGRSADTDLAETVLASLRDGPWGVNLNDPFKGGFLTRSKGEPARNVHAFQLEMSKDLYLDDSETRYDNEKAAALKKHLRDMFERLIGTLAD